MFRALIAAALVAGMIVSASCDTEPPLPDPPSFNGTSTAASFVAHLHMTLTLKGSGTEEVSQVIEYVSPDRIRIRQTGFDYLPSSAVIIGDDVWPSVTESERFLLLQWYSNIASFETSLAEHKYKSTRRGPRIQGERTNRYRFTRENIYGSIVASNEYIEEAERLLRDVDASFEILVGIETGRIYRIDFRNEGTYSVASGRLELSDFDAAIRIDPPAVSPSR
jgi:hypothetical protein